MKKTRIFAALLMVVALLAFTGCSRDDGTDMGPIDDGTKENGMVDDRSNDMNDMNDNGVVDNNNTNVNPTGSGINDNMNTTY